MADAKAPGRASRSSKVSDSMAGVSVVRRSARIAAITIPVEFKTGVSKSLTDAASIGSLKRAQSSSYKKLTEEEIGGTKKSKSVTVVKRVTKTLRRLPSRDLEMELWQMGFQSVVGVDEAGRGPLAGPVVAAACIIPQNLDIEGIDDSKKLTADRREELYSTIISAPGVSFSVCVVDAQTIDEINILQATMQAMQGCLDKLNKMAGIVPDYILIDGNRIPDGLPAEKTRCVIKGDAECQIIAAASILAKVTRDRLMIGYDKKWPEYGFKEHKGYGTAGHTAALLKHGPCDIHRRSFAPLKDQLLIEKKKSR